MRKNHKTQTPTKKGLMRGKYSLFIVGFQDTKTLPGFPFVIHGFATRRLADDAMVLLAQRLTHSGPHNHFTYCVMEMDTEDSE